MKILHTSDWHIGKRLAGRERLNEQRAVLDEIAAICERESVELVLVAGDVFDTFLPSAEAEGEFFRAVKKIAGENRCLLAISGNHDDYMRLTAAAALAEEQGIYLYGNAERIPRLYPRKGLRASEAGAHHIVFVNERGEEVFVNVLPYPNEARLKEDKAPEESFSDKMRRWIEAGQRENARALPSVFLSHLFVAGGAVSESEREIDLGGARAVPLELLPACDYSALGHLHKRQAFRGNVVYSGSILQYAFDEVGAEKSVTVFDLDKQGVHGLHTVPLTAGRKLVRLTESDAERAMGLLRSYENCYIELTLLLSEPLTAQQVRALREANEGLVSIVPVLSGGAEEELSVQRRQMSARELFAAYYKSLYAEEPPQPLMELFLSLSEDADET